ncbi:MAG: DPP IV N-terminal domain-containing protein [Desulfobacteraceae bacterium]|jgi:TolB protein
MQQKPAITASNESEEPSEVPPEIPDEPEMPSAPLPPVADITSVADAVWVLEPVYTRALTPIQPGHNDSNPLWSPSGNMLAFERSIEDQRKIMIAQRDGTIIKTIYFQTPEEDGDVDFFFPGITESASYNAGMSWSDNGTGLIFMSNGGSGNYDLYLLPHLSHNQPIRLTRHPEKDSHPHWSPITNRLVFVSGRTGKADIFTMNLATRQTRQITRGQKMYHYPRWSPDGSKIAMIYGSNENHDIITIENMAAPMENTKTLTTWPHDDLRPTWSPDGKKIAFYSNYNLEGDPKKWCIIVLAADGPEVPSREILSAGVVAQQVIPDIEQGPAWMPDSRHIVYVKNDEQAFNPIFLVDIEEKTPIAVRTGTRMNHDVTSAGDGTLAFRAQEEQWDHIYIAKIDPEMAVLEEIK